MVFKRSCYFIWLSAQLAQIPFFFSMSVFRGDLHILHFFSNAFPTLVAVFFALRAADCTLLTVCVVRFTPLVILFILSNIPMGSLGRIII